ncbi:MULTISPECIES: deoxyribose-phosphate aldolase [Corynebacterium]|nr:MULTISPECIES: deoxyribose-phosphate aldolase [Corynebacterium]
MDATVLKPEATRADVDRLISDALRLSCGAICVSPSMLPVAVPEESGLVVATVAGFPSGKHASLIKATEARFAVQNGADEVDVVIDIAAAIAEDRNALISELMTVREAVPQPAVLKVIVESAALTEQQLRTAVQACIAVGVDYVKTSTGFHPAGGASVRAVEIMAEELRCAGKLAPCGLPDVMRQQQGLMGIKASGGIRDWDSAVAMVAAGATRLGVSAPEAILSSRPEDGAADGPANGPANGPAE